MNRVTYEKFLTFNPCWEEEDVKAIYDQYPEGMTALDILTRDDVNAAHKLWSVLREDFIDAPILHEFACICGEFALSLIDSPDPRSVTAIETKRRWLRGEATDEGLDVAWNAARHAVRAAARHAASAAAWNAARAATRAAARGAVWDVAWAVAEAAAWDAHVAVLIMMLEAKP